jgi:hypothetical protein
MTDQRRPPLYIPAGACACDTSGACVCAPADLSERLDRLSEARYSLNDARDRGDLADEQRWRDELRRAGAAVRAVIEPRPMRKDADVTHTDRPTLRRFRDRLRGPSTPTRPETADERAARLDARDRRADAWRNQWREPLRLSDRDRAFFSRGGSR